MAFKFVVFAALLATAANAGLLASPPIAYSTTAYAAPIAKVAAAPLIAKIATPVLSKTIVNEEYDPNPQYNYGYDIHDSLTGDVKEQHEQRNGDVVQGSYSLIDADGYRRIVDYSADPIHGFNAIVRREPLSAAPVAAKIAYSQPIAAAPVAYAAPVAKLAAATTYIH